jgi:hypothetical protein
VDFDGEDIPSARRPIVASDGTSGSSHVFSTPKSQATTQVGDDSGGRDLSKVGLLCVRDVDDICRGVVGKLDGDGGGAAQFCTRPFGECRYGTHRENKAMIEDQTYYIKTPRVFTARLNPSLSMMCMHVPTEDDDTRLEDRLQPMDVWVTYINAINAHESLNRASQTAAKDAYAKTGLEEEDAESSRSPTDSTWVRVFAPSLSTFVRDVAGLKTPGRPLKRRSVVTEDVDAMSDQWLRQWQLHDVNSIDPEPNPERARVRPELLNEWIELMVQNWNNVDLSVPPSGRMRVGPVVDHKAIHNRFELQIDKLKEDGVRLWRQIQELQATRDAEMNGYDYLGGHSRQNPIPIDQPDSKHLEVLEARLDDLEANRGGTVYATHKFKFTSQHDVERFIEDKRVESCGTYWDLFSILVRMGGKKQSGHQLGQTTFAASRIQMTTL